MGLYTELFYAIIPACFLTFAVLLSLHLHTFLMFFTLVYNIIILCANFHHAITSHYHSIVAQQCVEWLPIVKDGGFTQWKTKVPIIALNFFPGFIGDSIVSTPCTLAFGDADIIEHKSISGDSSPFLEHETSHLCCAACTCAHSDTIRTTRGF